MAYDKSVQDKLTSECTSMGSIDSQLKNLPDKKLHACKPNYSRDGCPQSSFRKAQIFR